MTVFGYRITRWRIVSRLPTLVLYLRIGRRVLEVNRVSR